MLYIVSVHSVRVNGVSYDFHLLSFGLVIPNCVNLMCLQSSKAR